MAKRPGRLTKLDLAGLSPSHIESLSPHHIAALSTKLILSMTPKQIGALTQEQVSVLSLEQMGLVPPAVRQKAAKQKAEELTLEKQMEDLVTEARWITAAIFGMMLPLIVCLRRIGVF